MRIAIAALFVLLAVACGATPSGELRSTTQRVALYGENYDASYLVQLDPRTLKEVGPKLRGVDSVDSGGAAVSPDGSRYLIGAGFMGSGSYALASLRPLRWIDKSVALARGPNGQGYVDAFAWLRPHRVLTLVEGTGSVAEGPIPWTLAAVVDPSRRTVIARRRLPGFVLAHEQVGRRELVLLAPFRPRGRHRLALIDALGNVRLTAVSLPRTGFADEGFNAVGFTVDRAKQRVFLLPGNGRIAMVDLRTLRTRYRPWPHLQRAFPRGYRLPPENNYGNSTGPFRWAAWLGHGVIAVTGWDAAPIGPHAASGTSVRPYGLELIDTKGWTAKLVEPRADGLLQVGAVVLAERSDLAGEHVASPGLGLTGFSWTGRLLFKLYRGVHIRRFVSRSGEVFVQRPSRVDVVAIPSGRIIRRIPFFGQRRHQLFPAFASDAEHPALDRGFN